MENQNLNKLLALPIQSPPGLSSFEQTNKTSENESKVLSTLRASKDSNILAKLMKSGNQKHQGDT
jgi:hypothetical protein